MKLNAILLAAISLVDADVTATTGIRKNGKPIKKCPKIQPVDCDMCKGKVKKCFPDKCKALCKVVCPLVVPESCDACNGLHKKCKKPHKKDCKKMCKKEKKAAKKLCYNKKAITSCADCAERGVKCLKENKPLGAQCAKDFGYDITAPDGQQCNIFHCDAVPWKCEQCDGMAEECQKKHDCDKLCNEPVMCLEIFPTDCKTCKMMPVECWSGTNCKKLCEPVGCPKIKPATCDMCNKLPEACWKDTDCDDLCRPSWCQIAPQDTSATCETCKAAPKECKFDCKKLCEGPPVACLFNETTAPTDCDSCMKVPEMCNFDCTDLCEPVKCPMIALTTCEACHIAGSKCWKGSDCFQLCNIQFQEVSGN